MPKGNYVHTPEHMAKVGATRHPKEPLHGTVSCYVNRRCRCDECVDANRTSQRVRRAANRDKANEYARKYREANRDRYNELSRARYAADPAKSNAKSAQYNLAKSCKLAGITVEEYEAALKEQNGCCGICYGQSPKGKRLDIDHNHETGAFRGLLCNACNRVVLTTVEKNPEQILKNIKTWIEKSQFGGERN